MIGKEVIKNLPLHNSLTHLEQINNIIPFTTLFPNTSGQRLGYERPFCRAISIHQLNDFFILLQQKITETREFTYWIFQRVYDKKLQHQVGKNRVQTSRVQGPLISSGLRTFCQRCRHWTSDLSGKYSAAKHQHS